MIVSEGDDNFGRPAASDVPFTYHSKSILAFGVFRHFPIVPSGVFDFLGRNVVQFWHCGLPLRGPGSWTDFPPTFSLRSIGQTPEPEKLPSSNDELLLRMRSFD